MTSNDVVMLPAVETSENQPAGDVPDTSRHRALAAANRVRMLQLVEGAERGMTAADVAARLNLHRNTVQAHLDVLVESGLLRRERQPDGTPGRPAWRYSPSGAAADPDVEEAFASGGERAYRDLATALVGYLADDADPHAAGVRIGRTWGERLAAGTSRPPAGGDPLAPLLRVLEDLGFSPRVAAPGRDVVHLRSCPYLELAKASPDVVCGIHLGVIGGVLDRAGAAGRPVATEADLEPFAAPGACVVRLRSAS